MDDTAWEIVKIVRDSNNETRIEDALMTLLGFAPNLDKKSVSDVIWEMTKIIRDSRNEYRRSAAQKILVTFKNLELAKKRGF